MTPGGDVYCQSRCVIVFSGSEWTLITLVASTSRSCEARAEKFAAGVRCFGSVSALKLVRCAFELQTSNTKVYYDCISCSFQNETLHSSARSSCSFVWLFVFPADNFTRSRLHATRRRLVRIYSTSAVLTRTFKKGNLQLTDFSFQRETPRIAKKPAYVFFPVCNGQ